MKKTLSSIAVLIGLFFSTSLYAEANAHGFFISLDALKPDHLKTLYLAGKLNAPQGLGWLYTQSFRAEETASVFSTLTASSHAATSTCSYPDVNGIIANKYMKDGKKMFGFSADNAAETLLETLKRQNRHIISVSYVGVDGTSPRRSADAGITYPDDKKTGSPQTVELNFAKLSRAEGWQVPEDLKKDLDQAKESSLVLTLNPESNEVRQIFVFLSKPTLPQEQWKMFFDSDKNLANGSLGEFTMQSASTKLVFLTFKERTKSSSMHNYKRRFYIRLAGKTASSATLYISRSGYNNAHPESYRRFLDDQDIVWPDLDGDPLQNLSPLDFVTLASTLDDFFVSVAEATMKKYRYDVLLFYQPLLDSLGHEFQATLPTPFSVSGGDEVTKAYVEAYRHIDRNIDTLLRLSAPKDIIALMGDHGMDSTYQTVNLASLENPEDAEKTTIIPNGGVAFLYANTSDQDSVKAADEAGERLFKKLHNTKYKDQTVVMQGDRKSLATPKPWFFGDAAWAFFAAPGVTFTNKPDKKSVLSEPPVQGSHGFLNTLPSMQTTFMIHAPNVKAQAIPKSNLINAVPTFLNLLKLKAPRDCLGETLPVQP